jgi:hypothetical protein
MPERRALLSVPVDPLLLGIHVHEGEHISTGQQRGAAGQLRQNQPVDLLQLQHVPPGEGPQERPQGGRCPDPAEQRGQGAVPQHVHVIDAVRAGDHPGHQAPSLHRRVHPARPADPDMLPYQLTQASPPSQGHDRDQARPRHQMRVIKPHIDLRQLMQQSHLRGVLSARELEASATPIVPVQRGHLSRRRARMDTYLRGGLRLRSRLQAGAAGPVPFAQRIPRGHRACSASGNERAAKPPLSLFPRRAVLPRSGPLAPGCSSPYGTEAPGWRCDGNPTARLTAAWPARTVARSRWGRGPCPTSVTAGVCVPRGWRGAGPGPARCSYSAGGRSGLRGQGQPDGAVARSAMRSTLDQLTELTGS